MAVTGRPSERRALPMAATAPCAGIQVRLPLDVNVDTSSSRIAAILVQRCASGLLGSVTEADPLAAAVRIPP